MIHPVAQIQGTPRGGLDGGHQSAADSGLFQGLEPGDGRAAGAGDAIFEHARMIAGGKDHLGRAKDRLGGQGGGHGAGQAHADAAVAEGLDDQVDEGRPGTGKARHGVQELLLDFKGQADCGEQLLDKLPVGRRGSAAQTISAGPFSDQAGGIRHHPDQADALAEPLGQDREANAGGDGNHEQIGAELALEFSRHADHLLRFYRQKKHVGAAEPPRRCRRRSGRRSPGRNAGGPRTRGPKRSIPLLRPTPRGRIPPPKRWPSGRHQ